MNFAKKFKNTFSDRTAPVAASELIEKQICEDVTTSAQLLKN